jgi:peptidoglycan/LPS O-acetylase OafA/YrhL
MSVRHKHRPELQSLRGIAAVVVLFHHGAFLFATSGNFRFATEALFNAHAAVMIFFVLSGYVLTLSLIGSHFGALAIGRFYLRRAFRIYPAVIAVSLISAVYLLTLYRYMPTLEASEWYQKAYRSGFPGPQGIARSLLAESNELIPPLWTIRIEIMASLAMPLLAYIIKRGLGLPLLAATTVFMFAAPESNCIYLVSFSLGGYVAHIGPRINQYANLPLLIAAALFMYFIRLVDPGWRFEVDDTAAIPTLLESASAAIVVASVVGLEISFLRNKALVWLGDISYSVYLVHFVILSIWAKWIGTSGLGVNANALLLMAATLLTTLPVAHFLYKYVELPGILLGKQFLGRLTVGRGAAATAQRADP